LIRIRFLGGASVVTESGMLQGRAVQPRRMALLALLAASPHGVSRDRIVALLWPETAEARARHLLSTALYEVRKALGKGVIVTTGDRVAFEPTEVSSDVAQFRSCAEDDLDAAVGLYDGPFLDGFHLSRARGFDEWLEDERRSLARTYEQVLEALANRRAREGDAEGAAAAWQRLAEQSPADARVAKACMEALVASGNRAGALLHAERYARAMETRFGLLPDPGVAALARRIHEEGVARPSLPAPEALPPPRSSRPDPPVRREHGIAGRVAAATGVVATLALAGALMFSVGGEPVPPSGTVVRVSSFAATDGTPESAAYGEALASDIGGMLAWVPGIEVVTTAFTGNGMDAASDSEDRVPAGEHLQVVGSVERQADRLVVAARLLDASTGDALWSASYERSAREPPAVGRELSFLITETVRPHVLPFEPKAYTENERAYDRFLQGVYAHRRFTPEEIWKALQFYREAWEEDPSFALAHAIAGNAYIGLTILGLPEEVGLPQARDHVLEALALDSTLAEGHAALGYVQIWGDRDFEAGEASLRRAILLYPTLPQARTWYGWYVLYVHGWYDAAVASVRLALELDPLNTARSHDLELMLYMTRRYEEVLEQNRVTWSLDAEVAGALSDSPVARAYREMGRYEESVAEFRALHERIGGPPPAGLAVTYARMGREAEARSILRRLEPAAMRSEEQARSVARVHANLGDAERAFEWLERAWELGPRAIFPLTVDPAFDPIRSDPRFEELLARAGLRPLASAEPPAPARPRTPPSPHPGRS
jgi:DNA-binding SARP family transcriptional activator/TolB-like protein